MGLVQKESRIGAFFPRDGGKSVFHSSALTHVFFMKRSQLLDTGIIPSALAIVNSNISLYREIKKDCLSVVLKFCIMDLFVRIDIDDIKICSESTLEFMFYWNDIDQRFEYRDD